MPLYIVGLPGSGKSAVGRILKEDFGYDVVDFDEILKIETGKSFNDIIRNNGLQTIKSLEGKFLKRFKKFEEKIVVTLGTISNLELFNGKIIYIKIPKEKFVKRLKKINKKYSDKELDIIFEEMHSIFSQKADLVISSENKTKFDISKIIDDFYRKNLKKWLFCLISRFFIIMFHKAL